MSAKTTKPTTRQKVVSLKTLAEYLDLSPATISLVLNHSPVAESIPPATRQRVVAAAKKFDYRPNYSARSLRTNRSFTVGIIAPEHSEGYFTNLMMSIESYLVQAGYLYLTVSHMGRKDLLQEYPHLLIDRNVDPFPARPDSRAYRASCWITTGPQCLSSSIYTISDTAALRS